MKEILVKMNGKKETKTINIKSMTLKEFKEFINLHQKLFSTFDELHKIGFDFCESKYRLVEMSELLYMFPLRVIYNEQQIDWINWFIFETNYGKNQRLLFYPKKGSKGIKPTIKNIYKLLKSYENSNNKQK